MNEPEPPRPQDAASEDKLRQELRSLSERTGGIAHDLNNMLGTIIGYGLLVLEDTPADDPNRAFLEQALEAGAQAKQLVADLLRDSARPEAGHPDRAGLSKAA